MVLALGFRRAHRHSWHRKPLRFYREWIEVKGRLGDVRLFVRGSPMGVNS
jgi:hypothetical protein